MMFSVFAKTVNSSEYDFTKEFTQLNNGFNYAYKSNRETVVGINIEIIGEMNRKGKLLIIYPPFEENNGIELELEEKIGVKIKNRDWYNSECLIKYIPENEFVNGNMTIKIRMY